jgi:hypothetical protein
MVIMCGVADHCRPDTIIIARRRGTGRLLTGIKASWTR